MRIARRHISCRDHGRAKRASNDRVWLRLSTRDWDFFVADEIEAFAVIARHDVLDVEAMTIQ